MKMKRNETVVAIDVRLVGRKRTGDEAVFRGLVSALLRQDTETRYLLLTDRGDEAALSELREALGVVEGGNASVVPLRGGNRFVWNLLSVPVFLFTHRVDLFHTQYLLPAYVPRRTGIVAHIHDISFRRFPEYIGFADRMFLSLLIPRTMRRADLLVTPSRFTADEIVDAYGVSRERVAIVPNAADRRFSVRPDEGAVRRVRERYGLPERFVLSVGTMQPRKNIPFLVRAFAELSRRLPDRGLVLVGGRGGHNYDGGIDTAVAESGVPDRIVFPGYVEGGDLPAVYAAADLLVFPSRYEGFGLPLLEAFLAGVPVAASDIPPFREVGSEAVSYFSPDDVASAADAMYTLSVMNTDGRERTAALGNGRADGYSWNRSARILREAYDTLLNRKTV